MTHTQVNTGDRGFPVEFRVLGPIEAVGAGGMVPLGGERQRAVLAALLLRRGRPLSRDAIVDAVWEQPPATAGHAVEEYVSRLRRLISSADSGRRFILRSAAGYVMETEPEELDLGRFRTLAARGRGAATTGDWSAAWRELGAALDLWRGEPLGCLSSAPLVAVRPDLEDERLAAVETRIDAGLQLGLHTEVLPELRPLARRHPERERLWEGLMLALYRAGRQAEALDAFLEAGSRLRAGYGITPGPALQALQHQILEQDPVLAPTGGTGSSSGRSAPRI